MASFKYTTGAYLQCVTLDSAYTAGSGSMVLTSGHGGRLPASGDFWVATPRTALTDAAHIWKVTARSTDTLTVTCETDYSADTNLDAGTTLGAIFDSKALDQLRQDICQTGTDATKSGEKAGQLHLPSDAIYESRYNGSAWERWGPTWKCTEPDLDDFEWVNQGSATADTSHGGIIIYAPPNNGDSLKCLVQAAPATPYVVEAMAFVTCWPGNYVSAGLMFRHSSSGYIHSYGPSFNNAIQVRSIVWSSPTSYAAEYAGAMNVYSGLTLFHLRIADDGTNRICSYSANGYSFIPQSTETRTSYMSGGPDQIGFFADTNNATYPCYIHLIHWKVS